MDHGVEPIAVGKSTCAWINAMVTYISTMGFDVRLINLKVLSRSLLTCRRSVKKIRIKQTWGALSFTPTPQERIVEVNKQHVCF